MNQCTNCGAALEPGATICSSCGTPVAAAPGVAASESAAPAAAGAGMPTSTLMNLARGAKVVALLCFVLPWVTISCAGQPLASITGLQLATGNVQPIGANAPGAPPVAAPQDYSADIFVLVAALLIVIGLVVTFVLPRRKAALAAMVACAVAAALIVYDVFVRIKGIAEDSIRQGSGGATPPAGGAGGEFERSMQQQMEQMVQSISVDPAIGFWLTVLALIAAIALNYVVRSKAET
jgi:lysylphosphatidylglycerol synthetase-like protein (DUF2156 family)